MAKLEESKNKKIKDKPLTRIAVLVSGGGTNLQALIDAEKAGIIRSGSIELVVSNKKDAYALERAKKAGIEVDQICFFVTITDDDNSENIENITAKAINSGKILELFLSRCD